MRVVCLLVLASCIPCFAADPVLIKITVVDTTSTEKVVTNTTRGTAAHSSTNCNANATATSYGNSASANGTENCKTTTTPGQAPQTRTAVIPQQNVHAIMPDGTHITLWCQAQFRHCVALASGEYKAEVKGNIAWIHVPKLDGSDDKLKYKAEGGW